MDLNEVSVRKPNTCIGGKRFRPGHGTLQSGQPLDLDIQVKATNNTLDSAGYEEYQREKNIRWKDQQPDEDIEPLIKSNNLFHPPKKDEPELQVFAEMENKTANAICDALSGENRKNFPLASFKQHVRMQREIKGVISLQTTRDREKTRGETKMKFEERSPRLDFENRDL